MIVETKDLDTAHAAYTGKKIMREDMFRIVIDNIKSDRTSLNTFLQRETERRNEVSALREEVASLRQQVTAYENSLDNRVAMAASAAMTIWSKMGGGEPPEAPAVAKRGPGRPPLRVAE